MIDDVTWLNFTYPLGRDWSSAAEAEQAKELERICLERLEKICWAKGPECPKCAKHDAREWAGGPKGRGWKCRPCGARFYVLDAIPAMKSTHQAMPVWFRAIYITGFNWRSKPADLSARLGIEWKIAKKIHIVIGQLRTENPELLRRVIDGPMADKQTTVRAPRRGRAVSDVVTDDADEFAPAPPMHVPSAFDEDC